MELPQPSATYPDTWAFRAPYLTSKQTSAVWDRIKKSGFWLSLKPMPETKETLAWLTTERYAGNQVYFITSRPGLYAKYQTEDWLSQNGFRVPTVLIAPSDHAKGQLANALKLDVFIDDKPENIAEVVMATKKVGDPFGPIRRETYPCQCFLVDAPYNRNIEPELEMHMRPYVRVSSALEALERVQESQNGRKSEQRAA